MAGSRLLVAFLLGISVWIVGNELPSWAGTLAERPALILLATAPLTSAAFVHFCLVFCAIPARPVWLGLSYSVALAAMLMAMALPAGAFQPFAGVALMAMPNPVGWIASGVWAALAATGHAKKLTRLGLRPQPT